MDNEEHEIIVKPGGSGKGASKLSLVMMIVLTVLASFTIVLFFYVAEPKQPPRYRDMSALSLPADELPVEMLPYSRYLAKNELSELMSSTEERHFPENDDDEIKWYASRTAPRGILGSDFYIYIGVKNGESWGRLRAGVKTMHSVEPESVIIDVDGSRYEIDCAGAADTIKLDHVAEVYEYIDVPISPYVDAIRHVGHGQNVTVSFCGDGAETSAVLTRDQIVSTARMMRILRLRHDLEKDDRERAEKAKAEAAKSKK